MTIHREANLSEQMLTPIVSERRNTGDEARGRGKERLLEGCSWVWQFDVIADEHRVTLSPGLRQPKGRWSPLAWDRLCYGLAAFCEDKLDVGTMPLRVVLVDDHEVVRNGIKALLEETPDVSVVGEAGTVKDAIARVEWARPDVVIMDVRLPDGSGIEATREIRARLPNTQVLMLTTFADDEALFASIMAGAAGYVLKQIKGADLVRAVLTVGRGESLLDPAVTKGVLERLRKGKHLMKDERLARLSAQEERILEMIADGKTNREIGDKLHLAEKTVKNYVTSILSKLEVARRAQAAAYLARHTTTPGA